MKWGALGSVLAFRRVRMEVGLRKPGDFMVLGVFAGLKFVSDGAFVGCVDLPVNVTLDTGDFTVGARTIIWK